MRRRTERGTAMLEALVALGVLIPLVAGIAAQARRAHARQEARAQLDAAAWAAAMGAANDAPEGIRVTAVGPWRAAEDRAGRTSRRVPAW